MTKVLTFLLTFTWRNYDVFFSEHFSSPRQFYFNLSTHSYRTNLNVWLFSSNQHHLPPFNLSFFDISTYPQCVIFSNLHFILQMWVVPFFQLYMQQSTICNMNILGGQKYAHWPTWPNNHLEHEYFGWPKICTMTQGNQRLNKWPCQWPSNII